jgi:hypothetical protein
MSEMLLRMTQAELGRTEAEKSAVNAVTEAEELRAALNAALDRESFLQSLVHRLQDEVAHATARMQQAAAAAESAAAAVQSSSSAQDSSGTDDEATASRSHPFVHAASGSTTVLRGAEQPNEESQRLLSRLERLKRERHKILQLIESDVKSESADDAEEQIELRANIEMISSEIEGLQDKIEKIKFAKGKRQGLALLAQQALEAELKTASFSADSSLFVDVFVPRHYKIHRFADWHSSRMAACRPQLKMNSYSITF